MPASLVIRSRADAPHLKKAASAIEQAAWSHLGFLNYTRAHYEHYSALLDAYPEYQLCLVDEDTGYPVAVANSVPFACSAPDNLPPEGWDWVVETAARRSNGSANMLGALAMSVPSLGAREEGPRAAVPMPFEWEEATIAELQSSMDLGAISALELVRDDGPERGIAVRDENRTLETLTLHRPLPPDRRYS